MKEYTKQHKKAWEYNAYDFWVKNSGTPAERAKEDVANPDKMLRKYAQYFDSYKGIRIANICGSCGKKAVPLALLGADVTVFDISEENKRYAMETAQAANVSLNYEVCDILEIDLEKYAGYFDIVFMEGGILHYFHTIDEFMKMMYSILKPGGKMICSDFHPFTKILDSLNMERPTMSYFSTEIYEGEMAHARFFPEESRSQMPKCSYRRYTCGFCLKQLDEHPAWENDSLPGEFTAIAIKNGSAQ